jgi:glycosyltransferase involved in cell wall biosynthesis
VNPHAGEPPSGTRRLLVITYDFGHNGNVGGLRWAGITKYLGRQGWKVAVVTAAPPVESAQPIDTEVERCPRLWTLFDGYRRLRRLASRGSAASLANANGSGGAPRSELPGTLRQLTNEVATLLTLPDESHGWMLRATVRARSVMRRFRPHVVVSSGPPHSAHLVAGMATIGSVARWWIDLRDPWAGPMETVWQSHWRLGTRVFRTIAPLLERLAFRAADGVITNTTQLADVLAAKYRDVPFVSVPNGVDPENLPPPAHPRYPGVGLAYVGKLYAGRDLRPVVLALRTFLERHPEAAAAGSKLRVAGAADPRNAEAFTRAVAAAGLEQQVEALGVLSHAEALNVVSRSRLVVVLAQEQELQIPAKLYESVAMRVPTLVVAPPDSAAGMEGKRLGALVCDSNDVAGIAGVLEQLWRDGVRDQPPCPVPITYDAIAHFVDRVLLMGAPGALTRQAAAASV